MAMSFTIPQVKQELRALKEQRDEIDRKIEGLEQWLGDRSNGSVRNMVDIRPAVKKMFTANGNKPLRVKEIVDGVYKEHPEIDKDAIGKKMFNVTRTILEREEYGKYRLKTNASGSNEQGASWVLLKADY